MVRTKDFLQHLMVAQLRVTTFGSSFWCEVPGKLRSSEVVYESGPLVAVGKLHLSLSRHIDTGIWGFRPGSWPQHKQLGVWFLIVFYMVRMGRWCATAWVLIQKSKGLQEGTLKCLFRNM